MAFIYLCYCPWPLINKKMQGVKDLQGQSCTLALSSMMEISYVCTI